MALTMQWTDQVEDTKSVSLPALELDSATQRQAFLGS